uniref:Uncharacterized protein n=1 Tax=Arundo donax TaxID=35708 RepID=A0A0A9HAX6_ARUDO
MESCDGFMYSFSLFLCHAFEEVVTTSSCDRARTHLLCCTRYVAFLGELARGML